ncbi:unnamed protein product [Dimorphilus gyrociliatus]|uniref:Uncharacterized protein n=1 Tax=Dimorphilus gyrociliatus TaxID=2664684 RepID=A0A7I8VH90_9ANNE|nr:unnamed protein product [Dimorphilus gyrociliatus]
MSKVKSDGKQDKLIPRDDSMLTTDEDDSQDTFGEYDTCSENSSDMDSDNNSLVLDVDHIKEEEKLTDADYINNITNDSCYLIKSVKHWQEKYKLDVQMITLQAEKMLEKSLSPEDFGLSGVAAKAINVLMEKTVRMNLNELLDYAKSNKM